MWELQRDQIDDHTQLVKLTSLSVRQVMDLWKESAEFRQFFADGIVSGPFEAVFWETPPVTRSSLDQPFEYVLVEAKALERLRPDPGPFSSRFAASPEEVVLTFPNLGGDAVLVVPAPLSGLPCYTHLLAFLRGASREQVDAFWKCAGEAMEQQVSDEPIWLSTAGLGVSWLHLRLDSRPKYYRYSPYKVFG